MEPPKSSSIFRKSSNILKPIRCVQFTKAVLRHADIRDQNPSLGMICPSDPRQRNPNAPKFEDRSQEETEWQERCAREAAGRLAKGILKLKEKHKIAFFSPSKQWCLPAPSNLKPEEREFIIDARASMHMISKKDLNSAEMDTLMKSCCPTIHGYAYEWINGQKQHLIKNGIRIQCNTENFVPIVVPGLSTSSSSSLPSSTFMTPSRQEIDHPTSSSSSSTSPTAIVSSDSETRAREDLSGIDFLSSNCVK